jgi:RHS repeat-associated protein
VKAKRGRNPEADMSKRRQARSGSLVTVLLVAASAAFASPSFGIPSGSTEQMYSSGSWARLGYDLNSNLRTAIGVNVETSWATNAVSLAYDEMNRLRSAAVQFAGGPACAVSYQHDLSGNTTNIVYPDNKNVRYSYDAENRLTSVTDWNSRTTSFSYDDAGKMTMIVYPNGVTASFGYDADERLSSYSYTKSGAFIDRVIHRNALGFKTQENVNDWLNPKPTLARRAQNTFNAADQLLRCEENTGVTTNTFDANGNLSSVLGPLSSVSYTWDSGNRLVQCSVSSTGVPACVVTYLYDALGNRIGRISGSTTNYFVVNHKAGLKNVLAEVNPSGAVTRWYIWGPSGLVCHIDADGVTTHYYHADEQGSTLALTDGSGNVTDQFGYTPWGVLTARTGITDTPYQWLGGVAVRDEGDGLPAVTGLYAMQHRFYSATQKRFLSPDPTGIDSFPNLYAYGNMNPAFYSDPYGLCADSSAYLGIGSWWTNTPLPTGTETYLSAWNGQAQSASAQSFADYSRAWTLGVGLGSNLDSGSPIGQQMGDMTARSISTALPGGLYANAAVASVNAYQTLNTPSSTFAQRYLSVLDAELSVVGAGARLYGAYQSAISPRIAVIGRTEDVNMFRGVPGYNVMPNAPRGPVGNVMNYGWLNLNAIRGSEFRIVTDPIAHQDFLNTIGRTSKLNTLELPWMAQRNIVPISAWSPYPQPPVVYPAP